jgi:hypothetical protein
VAWEEEQELLTRQARLYLASPEVVYLELKQLAINSDKTRRWWYRSDTHEAALVERNDTLINLGLACYGANKNVITALYEHSLEPPANNADAVYKEGLRVGCLSNTSVGTAHLIFDFPSDLIGFDETTRILTQGKEPETTALIRNPIISDTLLEALYNRTDAFANMPEERWRRLVSISAKNERLVTRYEYADNSPDLGFMRIQRAIFALLETAPVNMLWARVLDDLLDHLDFQQTDNPERIDDVLVRWAQLDDRDKEAKAQEGYFTSLPLKEEFRCLIAAMYGRGHGSFSSPDIVLRCAYYGTGELTATQMKEAYERDKDTFVFASLYNRGLYFRRELRQLLEKHLTQLAQTGGLAAKYRKHSELVRKMLPPYLVAVTDTWSDQPLKLDPDSRSSSVETSAAEQSTRLGQLAAQVKEVKHAVILLGILLAALLLWSKH